MTPNPRTILIVEDDPATRKLLSIVLEREGLNVVALESVPEAFDWLEHSCPDLAVLDVNLPGGTGFEIVQRIQDRYGSNPVPPVVFMLSGLRQEHNVLHGLRLGVAEYLTKPFSPLELVARLRRHMPDPADLMALGSAPESEPESEPGLNSRTTGTHPETGHPETGHPETGYPENEHTEFELEFDLNGSLEVTELDLNRLDLKQLELTPRELAQFEQARLEQTRLEQTRLEQTRLEPTNKGPS